MNIYVDGATGRISGYLIDFLRNSRIGNVVGFSSSAFSSMEASAVFPDIDREDVVILSGFPTDRTLGLLGPIGLFNLKNAYSKYIERIAALRPRLVIFLSTVHVYGSPLVGEITVESGVNPMSPYADLKVTFEKLLTFLSNKYNFRLHVLRISNVLVLPRSGYPGDRELIIPNLVGQFIRGGPLELRADISEERDYLTRNQLGDTICRLIESRHEDRMILNVSSGFGTTLGEMITKVSEALRLMVPSLEIKAPNHIKFGLKSKPLRIVPSFPHLKYVEEEVDTEIGRVIEAALKLEFDIR